MSEKERKILLSLDQSTHLVMQALAVDEGISVTRLTERIVTEAVRQRVVDGDSDQFARRLQQAAHDLKKRQP